jgi:hypothetical protein
LVLTDTPRVPGRIDELVEAWDSKILKGITNAPTKKDPEQHTDFGIKNAAFLEAILRSSTASP